MIPVLLYHSVSEDADRRFGEWAVTPELFGEHMAFLAESGYACLTVKELFSRAFINGEELPPRTVAITFDDAFNDFSEHALPHLKRNGLTATVFVPTAFVGGTSIWLRPLGEDRRPLMSWDQLAEAVDAGIELGAHSHSHPQLDTLSLLELRDEITTSRSLLEPLGPVASFAYPHGYHSFRVRREVARAGFACACAVGDRMARNKDGRFEIPRLVVRGGCGVDALGARLEEGIGWAPQGRRVIQRGVWRVARRSGASQFVRPERGSAEWR